MLVGFLKSQCETGQLYNEWKDNTENRGTMVNMKNQGHD